MVGAARSTFVAGTSTFILFPISGMANYDLMEPGKLMVILALALMGTRASCHRPPQARAATEIVMDWVPG
ncbi:MAG TPA: hypothetical protein DCM05_06810 [Elusimicrobia bacterium]|nr:hypothetical protein [Elusimicrobiota bacterium]